MNDLHHQLSRRTFLRAGAVSIGLPLLNAMLPLGLGAENRAAALMPKRLLLIGRVLGCNAEYLFPEKTGLAYEATRYLKLIDRHRGRFTVFSGMSHLGYPNSHHTESGLFSGVPPERIQRSDDIRPTISLDQFVAERVGHQTRFPCVLMGRGNQPMIYNRAGVPVPCETRPEETFKRLFLDGSADAVAQEMRRLQDGESILDGVRDQLRRLSRDVGGEDKSRLDLLATSIREAEQNLAFLAFQTESTRVAVALEGEAGPGDAPGTQLGQHDASHHGQDSKKIEQFALYEEEETRHVGVLLDKVPTATDGNGSLLDHTIVFWGSNIGNPSAHASNNLPVFVAGGGFRHQGHVAFDRKNNKPLSNLYMRMLHQMGIEANGFGSSMGVLTELA